MLFCNTNIYFYTIQRLWFHSSNNDSTMSNCITVEARGRIANLYYRFKLRTHAREKVNGAFYVNTSSVHYLWKLRVDDAVFGMNNWEKLWGWERKKEGKELDFDSDLLVVVLMVAIGIFYLFTLVGKTDFNSSKILKDKASVLQSDRKIV